MRHFIEIKIAGSRLIERMYADHMPAPFLSVLIDDCIANGRDYNAGGARYNNTFIQMVGLGSITDSLSAIREVCFSDAEGDSGNGAARLSLERAARRLLLDRDFEGHETKSLDNGWSTAPEVRQR